MTERRGARVPRRAAASMVCATQRPRRLPAPDAALVRRCATGGCGPGPTRSPRRRATSSATRARRSRSRHGVAVPGAARRDAPDRGPPAPRRRARHRPRRRDLRPLHRRRDGRPHGRRCAAQAPKRVGARSSSRRPRATWDHRKLLAQAVYQAAPSAPQLQRADRPSRCGPGRRRPARDRRSPSARAAGDVRAGQGARQRHRRHRWRPASATAMQQGAPEPRAAGDVRARAASRLRYRGRASVTLSEVGCVVDRRTASGGQARRRRVDARHGPDAGDDERYLRPPSGAQRAKPRLDTYRRGSTAASIERFPTERAKPIFGPTAERFAASTWTSTILERWARGDVPVPNAATSCLDGGRGRRASSAPAARGESAIWSASASTDLARRRSAPDRPRIAAAACAAIRAGRATAFDELTILVTADHGHAELRHALARDHVTAAPLEQHVLVIGAGPGLGAAVTQPKIVDIAPTALQRARAAGSRAPGTSTDGALSSARPVRKCRLRRATGGSR